MARLEPVVRGFGSDRSDRDCGSFGSELPQQRLYMVSVKIDGHEKDGLGNLSMVDGENLIQ